jgi:hypothetical protein
LSARDSSSLPPHLAARSAKDAPDLALEIDACVAARQVAHAPHLAIVPAPVQGSAVGAARFFGRRFSRIMRAFGSPKMPAPSPQAGSRGTHTRPTGAASASPQPPSKCRPAPSPPPPARNPGDEGLVKGTIKLHAGDIAGVGGPSRTRISRSSNDAAFRCAKTYNPPTLPEDPEWVAASGRSVCAMERVRLSRSRRRAWRRVLQACRRARGWQRRRWEAPLTAVPRRRGRDPPCACGRGRLSQRLDAELGRGSLVGRADARGIRDERAGQEIQALIAPLAVQGSAATVQTCVRARPLC